MTGTPRLRFVIPLLLLAVTHAQNSSHDSPSVLVYTVSLARSSEHLVGVTVDLPPGHDERELQLPVWNALYQVRDFSQFVNSLEARDPAGKPLPVFLLNKSLWRIAGAANGAQLKYQIFADQPGPYGAQLDQHHAFFNLAEILMYPVDARGLPVSLRFTDVPSGGACAVALSPATTCNLPAANYDSLVDSPVEIGRFQESDFDEGGGHYRVVVDADSSAYDLQKVVLTVRRIVAAATNWMNDRPFENFLFIYHFPRGLGGGGMEHASSTAIDVNAQLLAQNPLALAEVTAHEFFHLWNVKRIRPQSLEPVDYTRENYTPALWFSEGVTNTVQDLILLRAGFLDEPHYLDRLAQQITTLEQRPAHLTQSAEQSSLDAWLEKYPYYRLRQRSISYYNKGDVLGVVLDLAMRDRSQGKASLRELFQWMNQNYARQGRFFPDSDGVRQAAEAASHADLASFFRKYVAGTDEIPWGDFFQTVGLHVDHFKATVADPGFAAVQNFDAPAAVVSVEPGSPAERAGLAPADTIVEWQGRPATSEFLEELEQLRPGETLHLKVRRGAVVRDLQWILGSREEVEFGLKDVDNITPLQKARRDAWLKGESQ